MWGSDCRYGWLATFLTITIYQHCLHWANKKNRCEAACRYGWLTTDVFHHYYSSKLFTLDKIKKNNTQIGGERLAAMDG